MKLNHLVILYCALLIFLIGGSAASIGIPWYTALTLPLWHPSFGMIAFIWAVIYALSAWSLLIIWNTTKHDRLFLWIMDGFAFVTLLNLVWCVFFFWHHAFIASIGTALLLGGSMLLLMTLVARRSLKATLLLVPYTLWVFFAAYIIYVVMLLN